ncbi:TPA: Rrf2 family transcriptional regulator [Burkholderia vietnamiensis]|uniref:Rrf2 family transcriptional regulator n=1 Tax=Burkholderia vietnamiensis TaxID=60552 RepID=UPI001B97C5B2|nr:Rrf2 family transcriptional regulator [Burkholderia vietnamiensis]MBR8215531.1 Rrf2 family transcriptional regulator [Burkholderia vietnamiensis]HDR9181115.1 Rrf2 family transcriptional regulator [Burkholderia vietnamiensis]HDV8352412.1 Rrf2 family transcriptional regulator [Burkholderia vietnamiensis]
MRTDSRISRVLHALIHMKYAQGPLTSEALGEMLCTNAVVVRRLFSGLRDMGFVASEKGHGGGWVLAKPFEDITLLDVYRAIGEPPLFSDLTSHDRPECLVEQAVNAHLSVTLREAEAAMLAKFEKITLAMLARECDTPAFQTKLQKHRSRSTTE